MPGDGEWHAGKHGGARRRVWRKVHLAMDEATLEVHAVEITGSGLGDAPVLPNLLAQIPESEAIASVTADGYYDTRRCRDAIANWGAVIPPRRNAKPWKKGSRGAADRTEALRAIKHLSRTIWRHRSGYHRRSRAEIKMNCMKLLGQKLMTRDFIAKPPSFRSALRCRREGASKPSTESTASVQEPELYIEITLG